METEIIVKEECSLYLKAFQALKEKIAVFDENGKIIFSNNSWNNFAGIFSKREQKFCSQCLKNLKNKNYSVYFSDFPLIFCAKVLPEICTAINEILEGKRHDFSIEYFCRAFGETLWFNTEINCINTNPHRIMILHTDITKYKTIQTQVTSLNKFLNSVLNSLPHPFYVIDTKTYSVKISNKVARDRGIKIGSKCHKATHNLTAPCSLTGHPCPVEEVMKKQTPVIMEHIHVDNSGNKRYTEVNACPIFSDTGEINQIIEYCVDITARKIAETDLVRKTKELELSNRELEQFTYVVSHDLKQPLFAIAGYLEILQNKYSNSVDELGKNIIANANSTTQRMHSLIENLMEYALIQKKDIVFEKISFDQVLKNAVSDLNSLLIKKQAKLTIDPLPEVFGHQRYLEQLMQNLISNAVKFCESLPEIHIGAVKKENNWVFSVKDNGIGIEEEFISQIFEAFQRLHSNSKYPGHGLGLAICKKITDLHKGNIWAESKPGKGTTFFFSIPDSPV